MSIYSGVELKEDLEKSYEEQSPNGNYDTVIVDISECSPITMEAKVK